MNTMRTVLCSLALCATTLTAGTAEAKVIRYQRLPQGKVAALPSEASFPKTLPGRQGADGIYLSHGPKRFQSKGAPPQATVVSTKEQARAVDKEGGVPQGLNNDVCFTSIQQGMLAEGGQFPIEQSSSATIWAQSKKQGRVSVVRAQRFVPGAKGSAKLYITDAFADVVSKGTKLINKSTIPLSRVAVGPNNIEVYAARDGERVRFIVARGKSPVEGVDKEIEQFARGIQVEALVDSGFSSCSFVHTTAAVDHGGGQTMTVNVQVPTSVEEFKVPPNARQRSFGIEEESVRRAIQLRRVAVRLSVSKSKSDRAPVVSVSFGWNGEAQQVQL